MKVWQGKPISPGYAEGRAVVFRSGRGVSAPWRRISPEEVESEVARFGSAVESTAEELEATRRRVAVEVGEAEAAVFDAHAAILRDEQLRRNVQDHIARHLVNAERAVERELEEIAVKLDSLKDDYLRERADDVRDLGRRLLAQFPGAPRPDLPRLPVGSVVVADELLPSDTIRLDRDHVRGILTERCGRTSHAAILAKALGIPAVSDLPGVCDKVRNGNKLLVDGVSGTVVISPQPARAERFAQVRSAYEQTLAAAREEGDACLSRDGVRIELYANLGRVAEASEVRFHGLDGVGLFRTEVLFLDHETPPTFEEQRECYRRVAEELEGLPFVIRALDLGGDKRPAFLPPVTEHNPTLGLRGLRFALKEADLLRTQLRAILDVACDYPVRVLFPMVLGGGDLGAAIDILEDVASDGDYTNIPLVGPMIETPSALFALDEIISRADFLSIGTNDLTQFMLAADRDAVELIDDYSMLHPSVLRAIRFVATKAADACKPLSVCGEAAGDPALVPVLVGLGIRQLSMSPARAPAVRLVLRETNAAEAARVAEDLLACDSLDVVRSHVLQEPVPSAGEASAITSAKGLRQL